MDTTLERPDANSPSRLLSVWPSGSWASRRVCSEMVHYGILWYSIVYSGIVWYSMVQYGIVCPLDLRLDPCIGQPLVWGGSFKDSFQGA